MKVLVVGHASYDISAPIMQYPQENTKNRIENTVKCGGGPAANAAHLLGKWGVETYFAGVVGNDSFGKNIIEEMKSVNINTDYLETNYDYDTPLSFILNNQTKATRTVFNCANELMKIKKKEFPISPDIILVDGHDFMASKAAIEQNPRAMVIIDAGRATQEVLKLCKLSRYIVCSKEFAETVTKSRFDFNNSTTVSNLYQNLKSQFDRSEIVVTLEDNGVLYTIDNQIKILPAISVPAIDTTGAGDIFHGAFTYGIASGYNFEDTIKIANITAAMSVTKIGSKLSIPSFPEFREFCTRLGVNFALPKTQTSSPLEQANIPAPDVVPAEIQTPIAPNIPIPEVKEETLVETPVVGTNSFTPNTDATQSVSIPPIGGTS